ncbi:MAG: AI-2E family transporter, partial [Burkholderiales bacterium]|nr:AI-2E family transporter [Burkholderiales bacterium]
MHNNTNIKLLISLLLVVVGVFTAIVILGRVLTPFIIALILTYIFNPLVEKINLKFKIKRSIISFTLSLLVFFVFLCVPLFIIPTIILQLKSMITSIPALINLFNDKILHTINLKYGTHLAIDFDNIKTLLLNNFSKIYNNVNIFSPLAKNSFIII